MKKLLYSFLFVLPTMLCAQIKNVYISNYELNNRAEKWCWAINQDQDNLMLLGVANGVVIFDGLNENLIKLPFTPKCIKKDSNQNFWISGYETTGILTKKGYAQYEFNSLNTFEDYEFKEIVNHKNFTYILSSGLILKYNTNQQTLVDSIFIDDGLLNETFVINDKLYFIIDYFLFTIENGKLVENLQADFPVDEFAYTINLSDNEVLLGTYEKTYYTFNGKSFQTKSIKKSAFFDNNLIVKGERYNDSLVILSSLAGGIALFDINKQKVIKQISYFNGLPDDEIRTFFIDKQKAIWTAHQFGISRLDFNLGIENYSFYPGLKGNPLAVNYFENMVYIATSDGLFKLSEIKDYNDFTVSVNVPVNVTVEVPVEKQLNETEESTEQKESKKLFSFLSKKKKETQKTTTKTVKTTKKQVVQKSKTKKIHKRSLKSVSHYYTHVEGVSDKCTQLLQYHNYLLIAGNNGLYAVKNQKATKIFAAYINEMYYSDTLDKLYVCTNNGIYTVYRENNSWEIDHFAQTTSINILSMTYEGNSSWALGLENMIVRAKLTGTDIKITQRVKLKQAAGLSYFLRNINGETKIFTNNTIYNFSQTNTLTVASEIMGNDYYVSNQSLFTWHNKNGQWEILENAANVSKKLIAKLRLYPEIRYIDVNPDGDLWLINENNAVIKIGRAKPGFNYLNSQLKLVSIQSSKKVFNPEENVNLSPNDNKLDIHLSLPFFYQQNGVKFRTKVEGFMQSWSDWSNSPIINISYLPPGSFELKIQAIDNFGNISTINPIKVKVAKPFTQTAAFVFLIIIGVILGAYAFFTLRLKKLKKDKEILEQKVKERTKTIEEQKSHIEKQHDEITQSIRYAKRIQTAMLPHDEIIEAMLPKHFILFMPRDIVSGDFYFFKPLGNKLVFVAADCTGHGVPGGFMSMLGISFLSEITSQIKEPTAAEILNHLREKIKITLGQTDTDSTQKDGMDLAICLIDSDNKKIQYSGAFNPLYILRNNELEVIKADRQPVAVYFKEHEFTNNVIDVQKGDKFYMFSDGFVDQIGGPKQRKFMTKNFKKLLIENHTLPMHEQHDKLKKTIKEWQGNTMQVDDILVVGFEI